MKRILPILSLIVLYTQLVVAQDNKWKDNETVIGKWKWSNSMSLLMSLGNMTITDSVKTSNCLCSPRLTAFFNVSKNANYNFSNSVGLTTGIEVKNLGFSYKNDSVRFVARNYYVGVPLYLRIGNFKKRNELIIGGGLDLAINYKQKIWEVGNKKSKVKESEWFSNKTNLINPYVSLGFAKNGIGLKFHYYFSNFYKNGYVIPNQTKYILQTVNTNIIYASLILNAKPQLKTGSKI